MLLRLLEAHFQPGFRSEFLLRNADLDDFDEAIDDTGTAVDESADDVIQTLSVFNAAGTDDDITDNPDGIFIL